jgi:feruloyl esterase
VALALPAHCRVEGILEKRTGVGGKTYGIGFAVALPENWTGHVVQIGGSGLEGTVPPPVGGRNAPGNKVGDRPALARGYAVVATDGGHKATDPWDASFMQDQQALLDFEYVAIGRTAMLARQIIEAYYQKPPGHSYFLGCSTGGREAMIAAQRFPLYFDGIVSGDPAQRTGMSTLANRTVAGALNKIAPRAADGRPVRGGALSDSDRKAIVSKLLDVCDGLDGIKDGMIFDPLGCTFDPAMLACKGPKAEGCLSAEQVGAIQKGFAGPKDSRGNQVYPGFFFDTGITAAGPGSPAAIPGLLVTGRNPLEMLSGNTAGNTALEPPSTSVDQDVDKEAAVVRADAGSQVGDSSSWTNLSTFFGHGGKLIFFQGVSDPWFSAKDTIDYYERMTAANGGPDKVMESSRLFLSPGMGHCAGGSAGLDTFDTLTAISSWVEKGEAPASLIATGRAFPGRSRPLCAYPAHAQYNGQGNPEDAANYECKR